MDTLKMANMILEQILMKLPMAMFEKFESINWAVKLMTLQGHMGGESGIAGTRLACLPRYP